jgi:hypothetical protein
MAYIGLAREIINKEGLKKWTKIKKN